MNTIDYLAKYYFEDPGEMGRYKANNLVNFPGVHIMTSPVADGAAAYIKISDFGLSLLRNFDSEKQLTKGFLWSLIDQHPGDNILIFLLATNGFNTIRREFRSLIKKENPTSVCWFDPKTFKLYEHPVNTCLKA